MNATISMRTRSLEIYRRSGAVRGRIGAKTLDLRSPLLDSNATTRHFSSYVLDGFRGGSGGGNGGIPGNWPVTKSNTIFNIVPQGHKFIVERFGKLHSIQESGFFFAIPLVDQIAYVIDVRERAIDIEPQSAITRDNVSVEVSGNLFVKFQDPEKAAYGALNPLYSVTQVNEYRQYIVFWGCLRGNCLCIVVSSFSFDLTSRDCFYLFSNCDIFFTSCSMPNLPCDLPLERWNSMRFCTIGLV